MFLLLRLISNRSILFSASTRFEFSSATRNHLAKIFQAQHLDSEAPQPLRLQSAETRTPADANKHDDQVGEAGGELDEAIG